MNAGEKFGLLTAVRVSALSDHRWLFKCECGKEKEIRAFNVKSGNTKSCGCLHFSADVIKKRVTSQKANIQANKAKVFERNAATGKLIAGVPKPPGPTGKGPDHLKAIYWQLKSPNQQMIEGWNLNELVRTNAHLFQPADLVWKGSDCRATKGLRGLFEMRNGELFRRSWKGWAIGDRRPDEPTKGTTK